MHIRAFYFKHCLNGRFCIQLYPFLIWSCCFRWVLATFLSVVCSILGLLAQLHLPRWRPAPLVGIVPSSYRLLAHFILNGGIVVAPYYVAKPSQSTFSYFNIWDLLTTSDVVVPNSIFPCSQSSATSFLLFIFFGHLAFSGAAFLLCKQCRWSCPVPYPWRLNLIRIFWAQSTPDSSPVSRFHTLPGFCWLLSLSFFMFFVSLTIEPKEWVIHLSVGPFSFRSLHSPSRVLHATYSMLLLLLTH